MNRLRGHHADARVPMLGVVPGKEGPAMSPAILLGTEALRKPGPVLERLELGFRIGIIIGAVRAAERFRNPQVRQQQGHGLAGHGRSPIGVDGQPILRNPLPRTGFLDELLGQSGALHPCKQPSRHIPAEDVEDDVEIEV